MIRMSSILFALTLLLVSVTAAAQGDPTDRRLEPGRDEIVRPVFRKPDPVADRAQNLKDTARIAELAAALQQEFRNSSPFVNSAPAAREAAEIESLIRKIRSRIKVK